MNRVYKTLRNHLARSPLHRPTLEATASLQLWQYRKARELHTPQILALGMFKTGTLSIAKMFSQHMHDLHEPHAYLFSKKWLQKETGQITDREWESFLIQRYNFLRRPIEASGFLITEARLLSELYPKTKFILTIREPTAWVESLLNHILRNRKLVKFHYWEPVFKHYFGSQDFPPEESALAEQGLFPIVSMLEFWKQKNEAAINAIPGDRLLILDTDQLSQSVPQIETFLNLPNGSVSTERSKAQHWTRKSKMALGVDKAYLQQTAQVFNRLHIEWVTPTNST